MLQLFQFIKQHKELNTTIPSFNYHQVRFPYYMLKLLYHIFQKKEIGDQLAIIFTYCFNKNEALTQQQKKSKNIYLN